MYRSTCLSFILSALSAAVLFVSPLYAEKPSRGMTVSNDIPDSDLAVLATWKPKIIRYPLAWLGDYGDSADLAAYNEWLEGALTRLDQVLDFCAQHHMKVVVDLHTPPGGFGSQENPAYHRVFTEEWAQTAFIATWDTLARRYVGNNTVWGYDLLNEPAQQSVTVGLKDWSALARAAVQAIRAVDTTHRIIVEPKYGNPSYINLLGVIPDRNLEYSVHMYYPIQFQHQGLYGRPLGVRYPKGKLNRAALLKNLQPAIKFGKKNKVRLYVGEFSAIRWAPGHSAFLYLRDVIKIFEANHWDWTYHAFRESDAWSLEHGNKYMSHARSASPTDRYKLVRKYLAKK